jgi:2,3-bisphosphoglycerate-dependent phosphoglycerate mutase
MTRLIIARHGNTFEPGETPRRVGARTDLPLTEAGHDHGRNLGQHFSQRDLIPQIIFTSRLKRTIQTAQDIIQAGNIPVKPQPDKIFNEIDYGPDENKTEDDVIARIGTVALTRWEENGVMPPGWSPDSSVLIKRWQDFSKIILKKNPGKTILVVTSNGIARFALSLTGNFDQTRQSHGLKLATGAYSVLNHDGTKWAVESWNTRP